ICIHNPDVVRVTCHEGKTYATRRISYNKYPMLLGYLDKSWWLIRPTTYNGDTAFLMGGFTHSTNPRQLWLDRCRACGSTCCSSCNQKIVGGESRSVTLDEKENKWARLMKFDDEKKELMKLKDIGDRFFFLGAWLFVFCPCFGIGFPKGNCVVFIDESVLHRDNFTLRNYVFHLDEDKLSCMSEYPEYLNLFLPPAWILNR
ncbi:F-box protein, partial [Trifolium medium]|nr:F-box protein [Trifolium medium]